ncbi:MAG TPA: L,D-transpeptidase [Candidatus Angelobacter sp.]|nr:L,D-transpeptidase [Candidatus Angelobacter sp.]
MRRHTAIPVKASAAAVLIISGAAYMAAEARQAVIRKQQLEIARIETSVATPINQIHAIAQPGPRASVAAPTPVMESRPQTDELAAERQAASMPARKPASASDGHTRKIVISISDRRLALLEDGRLVKSYPIAVGARVSPSPDGEFAVINHAKDPTYRHGGKEILPGKDNPLGTRWIGLSLKGYGIHGTNVPRSIGKAASHGCFRMAQRDVEELYSRVQVGDTVIVRRERDELIARIFAAPAPRNEEEVASNASSTVEAAE